MNKIRFINKYNFLPIIMLLLTISSISYNINAQTLISEKERPLLLEVYTSQGCSSCPPAEKWLNNFKSNEYEQVLWKKVIPINFHVDYWDYLGWSDPFADSRFTDRQWQYVQKKRAKQIATPGFIVDGKSWHGWFRGRDLPLDSVETTSKLMAIIANDNVEIKYQQASESQPKLEANIVVLGFDQQTKVKKGENKGVLLEHDFVAIAYDKKRLKNKNNTYTNTMEIPKAKNIYSKQQAIVVWVSEVGDPSPIQVVADWLTTTEKEN